ncbi:hypothetical protein AVEN_166240-1 [Araneus ventricosus]|uniref:Uncharacterized protein n=1 Tax=Araneus ventricosus TaxID=182803 RepID=A0A4Y2FTD8_ARAVE|nr:hypothetical protein AVEN_166240-1 [Araneus ventricosus]
MESTSRQKILPNVPKHIRKQHSYLSSDFASEMSLHASYCTMYYTLNNGNKTWRRRKQGQAVLEEAEIRSSDALGRTVHLIHRRKSRNYVCL